MKNRINARFVFSMASTKKFGIPWPECNDGLSYDDVVSPSDSGSLLLSTNASILFVISLLILFSYEYIATQFYSVLCCNNFQGWLSLSFTPPSTRVLLLYKGKLSPQLPTCLSVINFETLFYMLASEAKMELRNWFFFFFFKWIFEIAILNFWEL